MELFGKKLTKEEKEKIGHKRNEIQCPKCKSWEVSAFYFSFNPPVLECEGCGYVWEAEVKGEFKRLCRRFKRMMAGEFDY